MNVLVTGGSGFIGSHLVEALCQKNHSVSILSRNAECAVLANWKGNVNVIIGDLRKPETLNNICKGIDIVFHCAGYAHAFDVSYIKSAEIHWSTSVQGTEALLNEATLSGVNRFVFLSSVKAMGEGGNKILDETTKEEPQTEYGRAKLAAEKKIKDWGKENKRHICILRLPVVFGSGGKGNILRMITAIDSGRFPPLPETCNKRSMVHVDDVVHMLLSTATHDEANGQIYILTDGEVYSTREIYEMICEALGKPIPHWVIPISVLQLGARIGDLIEKILARPFFFNSEVIEKLLGSAWYSSEKASLELNYKPAQTLQDALPEIVKHYRRQ